MFVLQVPLILLDILSCDNLPKGSRLQFKNLTPVWAVVYHAVWSKFDAQKTTYQTVGSSYFSR